MVDGTATTLGKMVNPIRNMPTFRIRNSKNNPVQLMQTLYILGVSVCIGNVEFGNPVGTKSAGETAGGRFNQSRFNH